MKRYHPPSEVLEYARKQICPSFVFPNYHTLPVPTYSGVRIVYAVWVGRGEHRNPKSGFQMWLPHLQCIFDAEDGMFLELRSIGIEPGESDESMGAGLSPIDWNRMEIQEARIKYCQTVDRLLATGVSCSNEIREQLSAAFVACSTINLVEHFENYFMK